MPLPWSGTSAPYGFSETSDTWLPQPNDWAGFTVEAEASDPRSTYALYQEVLRERRAITGDLDWLEPDTDVLGYRRGTGFLCIANFGEKPIELPDHSRILASAELSEGKLPGNSAAWLWL